MAEKQLFHAPICKNEEQQIEEQRLVVLPCMPNILQDFGDYKQHETNEEEDADSMFGEISEPTLPLPSTEIEIIGNNICETLQGEDPFSILPLSQAEVHDVPSDKYELYTDASLISLPQQTNEIYVPNFDSYVTAEIEHLLPITCEMMILY